MITRVYNDGNSKGGLMINPPEEIKYSIGVNFDTEESRDIFCSQFPKSMKVYCGYIGSYENGMTIYTPYASIRKMGTTTQSHEVNKVTGILNESGDKNIRRFYEAVKTQLSNQ